jgi:flavin reductase (DIM6/NTAB) family NADH-FMN oxidoreductase RutF
MPTDHTDGPIGPVPEGQDPDEYDRLRRRVLWSMPTGLFVVGSRWGARRNLMTCNWAMQVAVVPKLVAVAVEVGSVTEELIDRGGGFALSVLPRSERALVRKFVKPVDQVTLDPDGHAVSLQGQSVHEVAGGLPCLAAAVSWLACAVRHVERWDGGGGGAPAASHALFVGEVIDAGEDASGTDAAGDGGGHPEILQMGDTRMNYGG